MAKTPKWKEGMADASDKPMRIQIRPDVKPDTPSYYVNYAAISHTECDFTMNVIRIPSQLTAEQVAYAEKGQPVPVEPLLQLVLPPKLIDGLIHALISRKERYETEFGRIRESK